MKQNFDQLPTPIALVAQRRHHATSTDYRTRFEDALLLGECAIKWLMIVALSSLSHTKKQVSHTLEYRLVRADGIGGWVETFDKVARELGRIPTELSRQLSRTLSKNYNESDQCEPVILARAKLLHVLSHLEPATYEEAGSASRKSRIDLFQDFAYLRNKTKGHGALRPNFYETTTDALARISHHR